MWTGRGKTAIVGVGYSELTRHSEKPLGLLALDGCRAALDDAGLRPEQIDGLATFPEAPFLGAGHKDGEDIVSVEYILNHLPLAPDIRWYAQIETGMIASPIIEAVHALLAGACDYALVWRAMHNPRGRYGAWKSDRAAGDAQFIAPYGCTGIFQWHAMAWQRYMHLYGATREDLATFVTNSRRNANLNPHAYFYTTPMSREDYFAARKIAEPLCLFDCDIPVEGCVALVLTTADRAQRSAQPARLRGRLWPEHQPAAQPVSLLAGRLYGVWRLPGHKAVGLIRPGSARHERRPVVRRVQPVGDLLAGGGRLLSPGPGPRLYPGRSNRAGGRTAGEYLRRQPERGPAARHGPYCRGGLAGDRAGRHTPGAGRRRGLRH